MSKSAHAMRAFAPSSSLSPRRFPRRSGNGFWNADNVPASTACIRALAAASPSIAPGCTNSEAQRSGRPWVQPAPSVAPDPPRMGRHRGRRPGYPRVCHPFGLRPRRFNLGLPGNGFLRGPRPRRSRRQQPVQPRVVAGRRRGDGQGEPGIRPGLRARLSRVCLANGTPSKATDPESAQEIAPQPSAVLPPRPEPATLRPLPVFGTISLTTPPPRP